MDGVARRRAGASDDERSALIQSGTGSPNPSVRQSASNSRTSLEAVNEPLEEYTVNAQFWKRAFKISGMVFAEMGDMPGCPCLPGCRPLGRWLYLQVLLYILSITILILLVIPAAADILNALGEPTNHNL